MRLRSISWTSILRPISGTSVISELTTQVLAELLETRQDGHFAIARLIPAPADCGA
jgi:hypothetical protein